jgi:hypothetical protein
MNTTYFKTVFCLLAVITVLACNKDIQNKADYSLYPGTANAAYVKVVSATVGATRNYVYNSALTPLTGAAIAFGGTAPSSNSYFVVNAGSNVVFIKDTLPTTTQAPLIVSASFDPGSYYSIFTYDTTTTIKYALVQDVMPAVVDTAARVRIVNLARGATKNIDVFSKVMNTTIFSNVSPATIGTFIPYTSKLNDTLYVREAGTTNLLYQLNGFLPDQKRYYSLVFRGRQDVSSGAIARTLSPFTNY